MLTDGPKGKSAPIAHARTVLTELQSKFNALQSVLVDKSHVTNPTADEAWARYFNRVYGFATGKSPAKLMDTSKAVRASVVVLGLPGSGKSTLIRRWTERTIGVADKYSPTTVSTTVSVPWIPSILFEMHDAPGDPATWVSVLTAAATLRGSAGNTVHPHIPDS